MARYNVLYENASGYSLFRVKEFEELAAFMPQVQRAATDLVKFRSLVQLVAFQPFKSQQAALDNANSISEGVLHEDLRLFLETNAPTSNKKEKYILGVGDSKIGETIRENLGLSCQNTGIVPEVIRGIRQHASSLIDGMDAVAISSAELSLGRSYSRAKVKFNVNRVDNMIIQSIALIDQLDKDINTFSMRLREWYGYHFPELYKIVGDNYTYTRCVLIINNRLEALEEEEMVEEQLQKALNDDAKVQTIMAAMKSSMGMDIAAIDLNNIKYFSKRVISLVDYRKNLLQYLKNKMNSVAPNLAALIGDIVGARFISHAGSLTNLAKYPASTVQILGAEKALFRALKTRGNTPKYGLIFHSTFIGRAESRNKGRISRFLANKCSMASRIDCFSELASDIYGNKLKEQVEERLRFYTGGQKPKRNIDVMLEAGQEVKELAMANVENDGTSSEKKKKKKKRKSDQDTVLEEVMNGEGLPNGDEEEVSVSPKKKKKKKSLQAAGQAVE